MVKIIVLCLIALIAVVAARPQEEVKLTSCSISGQYCLTTSDCCPGYHCLSYAAKCVLGSPIRPMVIHALDSNTLEAEETLE